VRARTSTRPAVALRTAASPTTIGPASCSPTPPKPTSTATARAPANAALRESLAARPADAAHAEEELGDLLFAIANLARKLGIEPEAALRRATGKFVARFTALEERIADSGRQMSATPRTRERP